MKIFLRCILINKVIFLRNTIMASFLIQYTLDLQFWHVDYEFQLGGPRMRLVAPKASSVQLILSNWQVSLCVWSPQIKADPKLWLLGCKTPAVPAVILVMVLPPSAFIEIGYFFRQHLGGPDGQAEQFLKTQNLEKTWIKHM